MKGRFRPPPGVIVNTLDGGLTAAFAPQDDSILVIGTAGQGVVNTPYQVTDRALAAKEFGFSGSLERGIEECASNSDNILAFRCGTKPMVLAGVGLDTTTGSATPGFDITFNDVTSDAGTRYQIWYSAGVLSVWKDGTLEYSNVVTRLGAFRSPHIKLPAHAGESQSRPPGRNWPRQVGMSLFSILLCFQLDWNILPVERIRGGKPISHFISVT